MKTAIEMEFHPLASIFPLMEGEPFAKFVADIKANGLREDIWTYEGKIVDGRNRYRACMEASIEPSYREWNGRGDLSAFILSLNLHRRHLTPSQRAMVAARIRHVYDEQAKEREQAGCGSDGSGGRGHKTNPVVILPQGLTGKSRDLAGEVLSVSGSYVDRASKVISRGTPELIKAVDEGRMNVTTAAVLSAEAPEVQIAECANPKRNRTYNSVSAPVSEDKQEDEAPKNGKHKTGVGIDRANEAINCLTRIPKNDIFRKRGLQIVTDWIRRNK